jgi:hypothetical protein
MVTMGGTVVGSVTVSGFQTEEEAYETARGMQERRERTEQCDTVGSHPAHVIALQGRYYACGGGRG